MLTLAIAVTFSAVSVISLVLSLQALKVALRTQSTVDIKHTAGIDGESVYIHPTDRGTKQATMPGATFEAVRVDVTEEEEYWREVEVQRLSR